MRITFGPWGETLVEVAEAACAAEEAGAEAVWVPELHRSATVSAAAVAAATSRAEVGTAIALAFTRSPMVTALEALDLDELSGGRFVLGLGTGVRRLNEDWHGVDWDRPVTMLREVVRNIREFWARCADGDPIELEGERAPMRIRGYQRPYAPVRTEIPVYLASMGPALTRLAGEIGDGWISHELTSPAFLRERILPELGAHGRRVDVVTSACCSVDRDPAVARRRSAGMVGFYATVRTYADFFDFHGLAEDQQKVIDAFRGTTAGELAGHVSDAMVDTLTLSGTREQIAEQVTAYDGLADTIKLTPPTHGLTPDEIRAAQSEVIAVIEELCR
ncbi:luciferase [Nocardioides sp. Root1257]|uniref:LLM class flavin-dependent oxidoreductase n=1 Tax=unclassified Nocardioides TaxID=2615069 RepID=UPI0006F4DC55|nr:MULTISPECIES: LLM class flavin-dependent oxidoreductase [unclassified Nocardioides]KQW53681.1 luciferase [Nocardioides sp. Root1257]KRC56367.1 luciferase [Nocardioides sp. Root224]